MAFESFIALPQPEWNPADFVFHRNDLQLRITFERSGKHNIKQRVLDFARLLHADAITVDPMPGLPMHTRRRSR